MSSASDTIPSPAAEAPEPEPLPTEPAQPAVTLAQAITWALSELGVRGCMPAGRVAERVKSGLAKHWPKGR